MLFGDHLSLKKRRRFGYVLSLNTCRGLDDKQSLSDRRLFCDYLSLNIDWRFWRPYIA
jgi:hypothetical protein